MIVGIDEVGRGPWAGPLVVGAVVLGGAEIDGLTDSKKLTKKRRETLDSEIRDKATAVGLGWVSADEIDTLGLAAALQLTCIRALQQIDMQHAVYSEIVIDGTVNLLKGTRKGKYVTTMKKADLLVPSVSAASIVAKVARDNYMAEQDAVYPGYGFKSHVGYGTAAHRAAIERLGVTPLHRLSFAPLHKYRPSDPASYPPKSSETASPRRAGSNRGSREAAELAALKQSSLRREPRSEPARASADVSSDSAGTMRAGDSSVSGASGLSTERMTTGGANRLAGPESSDATSRRPAGGVDDASGKIATTRQIGNASETVAAEELVRRGHEIVARNWKTKYCEVDIISKKNDIFYFTEVKHRRNDRGGDGLAAITTKKLNQMKYAAKFYAHVQKLQDTDLRLIAIATTGDTPSVTSVVEIV